MDADLQHERRVETTNQRQLNQAGDSHNGSNADSVQN